MLVIIINDVHFFRNDHSWGQKMKDFDVYDEIGMRRLNFFDFIKVSRFDNFKNAFLIYVFS